MTNKLIISIIFLTNHFFSQIDTTNNKLIDSLRHQKKYDLIINVLNSNINSSSDNGRKTYLRACYYALLNDTNKAFNDIYNSLKFGEEAENIITESDFNGLHSLVSWHNLVDTLVNRNLKKDLSIKDKKLATELWLMYIEDQRFRTYYKNNKKGSPIDTSKYYPFEYANNKDEELRIKRIINIIKTTGWPKYSQVGKTSGNAAFYIIQHSLPKTINKYFPLLEKAAKENEASMESYVMMLDRKLMSEGKKQLYGTQLRARGKTIKGKYVQTPFRLWPVEDEKNLNKRRSEIGLKPIEDYLKSWGIIYEYNPDNDNKSAKKIIKNWH